MTKIPKKQLFSLSVLALFFYIAFLAVCFAYAIKSNSKFFWILAFIQILILAYLVFVRQKLSEQATSIDLQKQDYIEKINLLQADMANERFALESWQTKIDGYLQLKELTEKLSMCLSLTDTCKVLAMEVDKFFGQSGALSILYLFDAHTAELGLSSSRKDRESVNIKLKKGDVFDRWVVKTLQPLLITDVQSDFRFDAGKIVFEETRLIKSLISAPLIVENKLVGTLRLDSPKENYFSTEDLRILTTISDLGAVAIENAHLYERVEELAIKDSLTGLYLRRYLLERLGGEVNRQMRRSKPLSLLMIDLDKFKLYNDKYGHMAGDIVLKTIGLILQESYKESGNLVCRYGGEEFVVLLPDYSKMKAVQSAEDIRKKISAQEIILRKEKTHITVSIGISTFPDDAKIKEELINQADQFMYRAKKEGRNKVCSL